MLKILHTSDWHLGNVLYGYDRIESEKNFLKQLADIVFEHKPDCMILSGDVYNLSSPSSTIQKVYTDAMLTIHQSCPNMVIVVTAGNHDSPSKLEISSSLWSCFNVFVVGNIEKQNENVDYSKHIIEIKNGNELKGYVAAVPHFYSRYADNMFEGLEGYIKQINRNNLPVILSCHLAVTNSELRSKSVHVQDMEFYPLEKLGETYSYIALGHIHFPQTLKNSNNKARYCGSPISVSFNEDYPHSVSLVEIDEERTKITPIEIKDYMPLKTVPKQSIPFDDVFNYVNNHKDELKDCFIRFNVKVKDYLPVNSKEQAIELCNSVGAYFCTFNIEREQQNNTSKEKEIITVEELKQMAPVDIATDYMEKKGVVLCDEFKQMIDYAMNYQVTED